MATKKPTAKEKMQKLVDENISKQMTAHPERPRRQNIAVAMSIAAQTKYPKDRETKEEKKPAKRRR